MAIYGFSDTLFLILCRILAKSLQPFRFVPATVLKVAYRATRHNLFYSTWATSCDYIDCQKTALTIKHQDKSDFVITVIRRNYKNEKSLKTNGKHGFDLKNFQFHNQLPIFLKETGRGLPLPPLATASGTLACGAIPFSSPSPLQNH